MAAKRSSEAAQTRTDTGSAVKPTPRLRLPLKTLDDVKAELARLYREGKAGTRDVSDVSKLGHVLGMLGRLIVDHELAARIEALEGQQQGKYQR
jgi:hypothetical protein